MKKISIIIPVYNVKDYIKQCIASVLKQKFSDYELILVDDGSFDGTEEILDRYIDNNNIKVFHNNNSGPSIARNFGIDKASGEYIMFMDSDDFLIDENCLSKLNNAIKKYNSDIIQYKMIHFYENKNKYIYLKDLSKTDFEDKNQFLKEMNKNGVLSVSPCDKVVRTKFLKENKLYFKPNILSEDVLWSYQLYNSAKKINYINEDIYVYRQQRTGSTTSNRSKKFLDDLLDIILYWYNYDYKSDEERKMFYNFISYWYLIARVNFPLKYYTQKTKIIFKELDPAMFLYDENYKVKLASKIKKIFGIKITFLFLRVYNYLKNKGIIKI